MVEISGRRQIGHLLRRAGFGGSADEVEQHLRLGFEATVNRLVDYETVDNEALNAKVAAMEAELDMTRLPGPQSIWLYRMLNTSRPLEEKMTLFWHDHFATANSKVARPQAMYEQNKLLRSQALGDFPSLLLGISRDPAMLRWLDSNANRRTSPNENYARELMELFTLGVGNYTENDVREAARAFTGWSFDRESGFVFNRNQHDFGEKTFLGSTGAWNGDDIIDIILRQPAAASFIAIKLFSFLAHDHPAPSTVARLAQGFRSSSYSVRELVRSILLSPEFSSAEAYHATVRSPIEYVVGSLKLLNISEMAPSTAGSLRRMGMDLYNPPDVAGWNWGVGWIGAATLLERLNAASAWTGQRGNNAQYGVDPVALLRRTGARTPAQLVDQLLDLLVEGDVSAATRQALLNYATTGYRGREEDFTSDAQRMDRVVRSLTHLIMSTPTYQMA